jgi:hypothetical protein
MPIAIAQNSTSPVNQYLRVPADIPKFAILCPLPVSNPRRGQFCGPRLSNKLQTGSVECRQNPPKSPNLLIASTNAVHWRIYPLDSDRAQTSFPQDERSKFLDEDGRGAKASRRLACSLIFSVKDVVGWAGPWDDQPFAGCAFPNYTSAYAQNTNN